MRNFMWRIVFIFLVKVIELRDLRILIWRKNMKLSAPKQITWVIAVILGLLGVLGGLVDTLPVLGEYGGWLVFAGFALLALATMVDGL